MLRKVIVATVFTGSAMACSGVSDVTQSNNATATTRAIPTPIDSGESSGGDPNAVFESNASNPLKDFALDYLIASETSMVQLTVNGEQRTLTAYNDTSGLYRVLILPPPAHGQSGLLLPSQTRSLAGLSVSVDGMNPIPTSTKPWKRVGPLAVPGPGCGQTDCVTLGVGDPYLATNGTRVLYTQIAEINGAGNVIAFRKNGTPDGIAITSSDDGGLTWNAPDGSPVSWGVAVKAAQADKESIDYQDSTALVAYGFGAGAIGLATSDDNATTWASQSVGLPEPSFPFKASPVVKLVPQSGVVVAHTSAYLAYAARASSGDTKNLGLRVARLTRTFGSQNWQLDPQLAFSADHAIGAGGPGVDPTGTDQIAPVAFRDSFPFTFAVSHEPNGKVHLWVAFRMINSTLGGSEVHVQDCIDDTADSCAADASTNPNWRDHSFRDTSPFIGDFGSQFQPSITVRPDGTAAAIIYYNVVSKVSGANAYDMIGAFSVDDGASWFPSYNLRPNHTPSLPCDPATGACNVPCVEPFVGEGYYYGDYVSSVILPGSVVNPDGLSVPWIVSSFSESGTTCVPLGKFKVGDPLAFTDQHVEASVW